MATKYGLPVVSVDFIHDSVDQGRLLNTDNYILIGKTKSEEFDSGKILGKNVIFLFGLSCATHVHSCQCKDPEKAWRANAMFLW